MRTLSVFNSVTLDGYFTAANGDMSWAHVGSDDPEFSAFVANNAKGGGMLLFGRITYEMMASFWPTPMATERNPAVAGRMNSLPKLVFSRTLERASWSNTTVVKGDPAAEIRKLKNEPGPNMAVLGSGSIVAQLAQERLIDEYQVVVNPVVLGQGRTLFEGVKNMLGLKLTRSRVFNNGKTFLAYEPLG
jgi:dihydrofolate reductase